MWTPIFRKAARWYPQARQYAEEEEVFWAQACHSRDTAYKKDESLYSYSLIHKWAQGILVIGNTAHSTYPAVDEDK